MIRSYLEMSVTKGAQVYTLKSRASSMHGPGGASISTSVEENGKGREVQARVELDGSWTVHELENGMRSTWSFTRKEVGLSTMDLVDPERYRRILDHEMNPMLIAETGQVAIGRIQDLGEAQVEVAGTMMTVQKISWTPEAGQLLLLFSESGLLVDYSLDFMGKRLHAKLEALPEERSWGGFEPAVFGGVSEEEL
jgi:hypothetical protein